MNTSSKHFWSHLFSSQHYSIFSRQFRSICIPNGLQQQLKLIYHCVPDIHECYFFMYCSQPHSSVFIHHSIKTLYSMLFTDSWQIIFIYIYNTYQILQCHQHVAIWQHSYNYNELSLCAPYQKHHCFQIK